MGWAVGWDTERQRDVGYGVPAICDHPGCTTEIDRGLGYRCGGTHNLTYDEVGCGLFFCAEHLSFHYYPDLADPTGVDAVAAQVCARCKAGEPPFEEWSPDTSEWLFHKATDPSWAAWRDEHPATAVAALQTDAGRQAVAAAAARCAEIASDITDRAGRELDQDVADRLEADAAALGLLAFVATAYPAVAEAVSP